MLPGSRADDWQREYASWAALVDGWRGELTRLAGDFAAGAAAVAPKKSDTCRYCTLVPLCRLNERAGASMDEDMSGGVRDE